MTPELLSAVRARAGDFNREVGGVFIITQPNVAEFFPCKNTAERADIFSPCYADTMAAEDRGPLVGYVHTHNGSCEPSQTDLEFCARSRRPWWIVSQTGFRRVNPGMKLEGRQFAWGVQDCYTLIMDWYAASGVVLPDFVREKDFWLRGEDPYMDGLKTAGFSVVDAEPDLGDGVLMSIRSRNAIPNHGAVHIGDTRIIHHLPNRLSMVELYDDTYRWFTSAVVRRSV